MGMAAVQTLLGPCELYERRIRSRRNVFETFSPKVWRQTLPRPYVRSNSGQNPEVQLRRKRVGNPQEKRKMSLSKNLPSFDLGHGVIIFNRHLYAHAGLKLSVSHSFHQAAIYEYIRTLPITSRPPHYRKPSVLLLSRSKYYLSLYLWLL